MSGLQRAIDKMTATVSEILSSCHPSIYLYGSAALNDFRLGWSDIDSLCLTRTEIPQPEADRLVGLRQTLLQEEPDNPYYRSFEGGMLPLDAFLNHTPSRVAYWGTSGQRLTDRLDFDSFCMTELLANGILLYGDDVRALMKKPAYDDLLNDVKRHYEAIRKYAQTTGRSIYAFGWLLDIARGLYTLRTGNVIAKTAAGKWALENGLCPVPEALQQAVDIRKEPLQYKNDPATLDRAQTLGAAIQRFADVLEAELAG